MRSGKLRSQMGAHSFQIMPDEILEKIFNFLSFKEKRVARFVCRRWFRILNYDGLISLHVQLNDKTISNAQYFTKPHLASLTVKKLSRDLTITFGPTTKPPTISKLILQDGISFLHLTKLLKYYTCSNIKQLEFASLSLTATGVENIPKLIPSFTKWNYLQTLKLSATGRNKYASEKYRVEFTKHIDAIAKVLKHIYIPNLMQLSLHLDCGLLTSPSNHHPLENVYIQLASFLHRHANHAKLKGLNLKWKAQGFARTAVCPPELWQASIVQLESIRIELKEFSCFNYVEQFLNSQKKVRNIEMLGLGVSLANQLLINNSSTLESISIYGSGHQLPILLSFANLKFLTVGFYNLEDFENTTLSLSTSTAPKLGTFNLIDTHLLSSSFLQNFGRVPVEVIGHVSRILLIISSYFHYVKNVWFIVRGDSEHVSEIDVAAVSILEKLQEIKTMSVTTHEHFDKPSVKKEIDLACNLVQSSGKSSKQYYYERSIEVKFHTTSSITLDERPLF